LHHCICEKQQPSTGMVIAEQGLPPGRESFLSQPGYLVCRYS
jgi:hypothetical protein